MDFELGKKEAAMRDVLLDFMDEHVYPAERSFGYRVDRTTPGHPSVAHMERLKSEARSLGLWNLFLPDRDWGPGLSNLEYAPLAEITGWSPWIAPEALNCSAPDTGNMEILARFGTPEQQERWLVPLLAGEIRSCFAMTEPDVASSDATNIRGRIKRDGDEFVIDGRKWWISSAMDPRCKVAIFMGVTDPEAHAYRRQSMILVPLDAPGVQVQRPLDAFGYDLVADAEILFEDVRVPVTNLLGDEGDGFAIAQARLGPGRVHHCMRCIGMAERALHLMCARAKQRVAFGRPLSDQGVIQEWIAEARAGIEQTRLLILKTAWLMDTAGGKQARKEIAAIKVLAPAVAIRTVDRAIQVHGGAGVSEDFPLASMYAFLRGLQIADGPDEVHKRTIARLELRGPGDRVGDVSRPTRHEAPVSER